MNIFDYYLAVWKKYATFSGRARRKEYWSFAFINIVISIVLPFVAGLLLVNKFLVMIPTALYMVAAIIPGLAVTVRRLHDTSRSGWWILISLIPYLGSLILLVLLVLDSKPGDNQYGPSPKGAASLAVSQS